MRVFSRMLVTAALLPLAAGCGFSQPDAPVFQASAEPAPPIAIPAPPMVSQLPPTALGAAEAERLLADDAMALRFLALRRLGDEGLATVDDLTERQHSNLGALLPLTFPLPPASGLERPIPPLDQLMARFNDLKQGRGTERTRAAERDFMLDALLPKAPASRTSLAPHDQQSARMAMERLDRVGKAGLVTPAEKEAEAEALTKLMATLPETLTPPPPEPPKKKKKVAGRGRGSRLSGGVSGKLEVVPSPPGVAAPKVAAGFAGPVGLHLLSMGSAGHGDRAWEALKKEFAELAPLSFKISRADLGDLGATYRLIAGPLDAAAAERMCGGIRAKGQSCQPTPFPQ